MQRIRDKYWGGSRPSEFILYVYVDKKKDDRHEHTYDYRINSQYNKTYVHDEDPENIDGYETTHTWGVQLNSTNITSSGLILICNQSGGEPTGELLWI